MKFSELNKEQKQLLILAVGGVLTFFMVMANVVIGPAKAEAATARKTIQELEDKVTKGERTLQRNVMVQRDTTTFSTEILAVHQNNLPPQISPYIWAVENLSLLAEQLDLVISVQEHPTARYMPIPSNMDKLNVNSIPFWIPYTVDVKLDASFSKLKSFLSLLEENLPFAAIAGLRVQTSLVNPEQHEINLMVEWPTFRFQEDLDNMTAQGKSGDRP